jgi:3-oxoacyl-[acyl-carrier-protein] synthase II
MTNGDNYSSAIPYVSSTKGATGHLLGAAGALEAAITVMSIVEQKIPPTLNLERIEADSGDGRSSNRFFQHVQEKAVTPTTELNAAMSNSFGFGGTNSSLIFCKYEED